jgi:hypothetical protein
MWGNEHGASWLRWSSGGDRDGGRRAADEERAHRDVGDSLAPAGQEYSGRQEPLSYQPATDPDGERLPTEPAQQRRRAQHELRVAKPWPQAPEREGQNREDRRRTNTGDQRPHKLPKVMLAGGNSQRQQAGDSNRSRVGEPVWQTVNGSVDERERDRPAGPPRHRQRLDDQQTPERKRNPDERNGSNRRRLDQERRSTDPRPAGSAAAGRAERPRRPDHAQRFAAVVTGSAPWSTGRHCVNRHGTAEERADQQPARQLLEIHGRDHTSRPVIGVATALLAIAMAATGCGESNDQGPRGADPTNPATSSTATEPPEAAEILAAFEGYRRALRAANESGTDAPTEELRKYLTDPLLSEVVAQLHRNRLRGVYYAGSSVAVDPRVTEVRSEAKPKTAALVTCVDNSDYRLVYRSNNSPVPVPSGNRRTMASYTASYVDGQGWRISDSTSLDQPC